MHEVERQEERRYLRVSPNAGPAALRWAGGGVPYSQAWLPHSAPVRRVLQPLQGVQPVDAKMIGADVPKHDMDQDDAMGSMDMAKMRDMVSSPDQEKQDETFANEPEEKVQDVDSLVNKHSGGLNRQKTTYPKVASGDNPMAYSEDKITEEELANSLRT